jgi:hypothetical protein
MTTISGASALADALKLLQAKFTKADADGNGKLSATEFTSTVGNTSATGTEAGTLFKQLDTDGDGQLTDKELTDGTTLATKVHDALLKAQELMSGATLMNMLGGKSQSSDSVASLFSDGNTSTDTLSSLFGGTSSDDTSSTDSYTAMLQSLIAKYNDTANVGTDETAATPTTTQEA